MEKWILVVSLVGMDPTVIDEAPTKAVCEQKLAKWSLGAHIYFERTRLNILGTCRKDDRYSSSLARVRM
jgi:hypothetical protein